MYGIFENCRSLITLPDISKWNISKFTGISRMFISCESLMSLPDISKWTVENFPDMQEMIKGCYSLISLPDLSKWNYKVGNNNYDCFNNLNFT